MILIIGSNQCGKTVFIQSLLKKMKKKFVLIDSDYYGKEFFSDVCLPISHICSDEFTYSVLNENLKEKINIIYERNFVNFYEIDLLKEILKKHNYKLEVYYIGKSNLDLICANSYINSITVLFEFIFSSDKIYFIDNDESTGNQNYIGYYSKNKLHLFDSNCEWFNNLVKKRIAYSNC